MGKLFRSLSVFSLATLLSRITGLARELSLAYFFGASAELDLFWIAYRIPNFLRKLFAEGALSQAMVPVLSEYQTKQDRQEKEAESDSDPAPLPPLNDFINQMHSWMLCTLILITLIVQVTAPYIIWFFAPGIARDASRATLAIQLLKIMFPALIFISLAAYSGSILNSRQQFGIPALAQNWFNIIVVAVVWFLVPHSKSPIHLLAFGVLLSSVIQWLFQLPSLAKLKMVPKLVVPRFNPGVRKVVFLMMPAIFGISVTQINILIDTFLVSFLPPGSVSWLNYADRLTSLPLGVVGVALATIILPKLSREYFASDARSFKTTLTWAIQCMLLVAMPCMLILQLLAEPIIATLFQRGVFTARDTFMTARALRCLALGIPAFMSVKILAACFYAQQNLKTPVKIAAVAVVTNGILAAIFSQFWQHAGISLATALSSYLNAALLWYKLRKTGNLSGANTKNSDDEASNGSFVKKLILALAALVAATLSTKYFMGDWQTMRESMRLIKLFVTIAVAFTGYFAALIALRMPLKQLLKS